jgi:hypothetical protein
MPHISTNRELHVYQAALDAAVRIFELTKCFPHEERYSIGQLVRMVDSAAMWDIPPSKE